MLFFTLYSRSDKIMSLVGIDLGVPRASPWAAVSISSNSLIVKPLSYLVYFFLRSQCWLSCRCCCWSSMLFWSFELEQSILAVYLRNDSSFRFLSALQYLGLPNDVDWQGRGHHLLVCWYHSSPLNAIEMKIATYVRDRHIFCLPCADHAGLSQSTGIDRQCPACQSNLHNPDDVVSTTLNPTEDYKTSVLSGLDPNTIMECAGRAMAFWAYQAAQEMYGHTMLTVPWVELWPDLHQLLSGPPREKLDQ